MDGVTDEDLNTIANGPVDYIALNKLAIDHCDAIAQASANIDQELIDYAKASGKPFLEYPGEENYVDAYAEFYNSL
jgi:starch synthase